MHQRCPRIQSWLITLIIATMALTAAAYIACGPATQSPAEESAGIQVAPQEIESTPGPAATDAVPSGAPIPEPVTSIVPQQNNPDGDPPPEPTPEPECPHTQGEYPMLDETLQDLVRKFETCALTETEAAALAPEHYDNAVLVQVDITGSSFNTVDAWMEQQAFQPRHADIQSSPPYIYTFARVSLLGDLATLEGVEQVTALASPFGPEVEYDIIRESADGTRSTSEPTGPELPVWLKGVPYPGVYPTMTGDLRRTIIKYEAAN